MFPNRQIIVVPDASGQARKTSAQGNTDHSLLRQEGLQVDSPKANPRIRDRVNALNSLIKSQDGTELFSVDPSCKQLIAALNAQTWDEKTGEPDKKAGYDHPLDGLGYLVHRRFNKLAVRGVKQGQVAL